MGGGGGGTGVNDGVRFLKNLLMLVCIFEDLDRMSAGLDAVKEECASVKESSPPAPPQQSAHIACAEPCSASAKSCDPFGSGIGDLAEISQDVSHPSPLPESDRCSGNLLPAVVPAPPPAELDAAADGSTGAKDTQKRRKGPNICLHGRVWSVCRQCGGGSICQHNRRRSVCKDCGGGGICEHGKQKTQCKACGGACVCPHGKQKSQCKDCGGGSICPHDRVRSKCRECGGGSICRHKKRRSMCVDCGGGSVCEHGKRKLMCKLCSEPSPSAAPAVPPPSKRFTREDYLRILLQSPAGTTALAAPPVAPLAPAPSFHFPTAAESLASMYAVATSFSNLEFLKFLEASAAQPAAFALPSAFPLVNPFASSMILGVSPLLPSQCTSAAAPPSFNAVQNTMSFSQNPLSFNHT
jgi:hypothetical protein